MKLIIADDDGNVWSTVHIRDDVTTAGRLIEDFINDTYDKEYLKWE